MKIALLFDVDDIPGQGHAPVGTVVGITASNADACFALLTMKRATLIDDAAALVNGFSLRVKQTTTRAQDISPVYFGPPSIALHAQDDWEPATFPVSILGYAYNPSYPIYPALPAGAVLPGTVLAEVQSTFPAIPSLTSDAGGRVQIILSKLVVTQGAVFTPGTTYQITIAMGSVSRSFSIAALPLKTDSVGRGTQRLLFAAA